jgi:hypothetical protein
VHREQLKGKLDRLVEELRIHGGNGLSVYARRLRDEIAATEAEMEGLTAKPSQGREQSIADRRDLGSVGSGG